MTTHSIIKSVFVLTLVLQSFLFSQVLHVRENIQEQDQWCWAASTCTVLQYYDEDIPQCQIAEYTRTVATWHSFGAVNCCTSASQGCNYWNYNWGYPGSMQDILAHWGVDNGGVGVLSLVSVQNEISHNRPFIFRWQWSDGSGHFLVGHGLVGTTMYYMDPWFGEGLHIADYSWVVSTYPHTWTHTNVLSTGLVPPSVPTPVNPPPGAIDEATTLNLTWNASIGAYQCGVQVATDSFFTSLIVNDSVFQSPQTVTGLAYGTRYYWRVSEINNAGMSAYSPTQSFTTYALPAAPVQASPADGSANQPSSLTLTWNALPASPTYRVQVASDHLFTQVVFDDSTITDTSKNIGPLNFSTQYYWRVCAKKYTTVSAYSTQRMFRTIVGTPLQEFPASGALQQQPNLQVRWRMLPGATSYHIQVADNGVFGTTLLDDSTVTDTSTSVTGLDTNETVYWRLRAKDEFGLGAWSSAYHFTTLNALPSTPILISPIDIATELTPRLSWQSCVGTGTYQLQISEDSDFTAMIMNDSTLTDTSYIALSLSYGKNYYWHVRAWNVLGSSPWSNRWKFVMQKHLVCSYANSWNLVSIPFNNANCVKDSLFSASVSGAYCFSGGVYAIRDTLSKGTGYWLKFPPPPVVPEEVFIVPPVSDDTIPVAAGWNLIGAFQDTVAFSNLGSDTPNLVTSHAFGYYGHYQKVDTLYPGQGYWVKAMQAGSIIYSSGHSVSRTHRISIVPVSDMPPEPPIVPDAAREEVPKNFLLAQAYPNPFNPGTVIQYQLPASSHVLLKVYNMLGQEIATLVDEQQGAGYKSVKFQMPDLPSGIYIYRLTAGSYTDVKKMIFMK
ncbi:MAG: T9SS type A sorting domain-containing protein [Bacteroidota bacterium]